MPEVLYQRSGIDEGIIGSPSKPDSSRTRWELRMITELRCSGTMHGKLDLENRKLEVKCGRRGCGAKRGVVVLHIFDLSTGRMIGTRKFADPNKKDIP
jgi:hypothetical protein